MNYEKQIEIMQNNLLHIRKSIELSREAFGEMIGLRRQSIYNLESGKVPLSKTNYLAIMYVLENIILPTMTDDDRMNVRKLLQVKVVNSNYMKSLTFKEES